MKTMTSRRRQFIFAIAAAIGVVVTWYWNILFMIEHGGFSVQMFLAECYANAASTSISNDILVAVFTFLFWSWHEARRLGMRHWWAYVVLTFGIAIAFAFPLFMFMRERRIANLDGATQGDAAATG